MNKIDKRTGETFPSVLQRDAIDVLTLLPDSASKGHARQLERVEVNAIHLDNSRDWSLSLDPQSLMDYGAFETLVAYGHLGQGDPESGIQERPLEWFQRVAELIHDRMDADEALWQAINDIFDQARDLANDELGFKEDSTDA